MRKVLILGDLHISDVYQGKHKDYIGNCEWCVGEISKTLKERKVTDLILLGDIIGQTEKNLKKRTTLLKMMKWLNEWSALLKENGGEGEVYSLRGNHDIGSKLTDFEMFEELGLLKTGNYKDVGVVRYHLIDYGEERREIELDEEKVNVALMHNNIMVEGLTTWYRGGEGIEMSTLENLYGVEMIIAGHIHNPSARLVVGNIKESEVSLYYPGCITRPRYEEGIWEKAFGVLYEIEGDEVNLETVEYKLKSIEEVYNLTYEDIETEDLEGTEVLDVESLTEILNDLTKYSIGGTGDYKSQLEKYSKIEPRATEVAIKYIEEAESRLK